MKFLASLTWKEILREILGTNRDAPQFLRQFSELKTKTMEQGQITMVIPSEKHYVQLANKVYGVKQLTRSGTCLSLLNQELGPNPSRAFRCKKGRV